MRDSLATKTDRADAETRAVELARRLLAGDRGALARALSLVDRGAAEAKNVLKAVAPSLGRASVFGFTGAPGAGKSTLVSAFAAELRRRERTVGVVAVDPSSPITGGAILGDRIRMAAHAEDPGVFVRSLASRGHLGGLSASAVRIVDLMDAAGFLRILVETVGAGQSEVEIAGLADVRIVVLAPGLGDEVQAIKAGILEIADILVVNKADHPAADVTARQLAAMTQLGLTKPPVLKTNAVTGEGVGALVDAAEEAAARSTRKGPEARARLAIAALAAQTLRARLADERTMQALAQRVAQGTLDPTEAAQELLRAPGGRS